ncbi:gelsolin-like protein 2 [Diadema antillarum]|uniref:gelsolin-like protein 2 n=1 Tax=Diadema antillarum TaxID=105358 RepID=UPI003A8B34B8
MQKAKEYDWQDSNLALFGSDTEKQVKKESAESEPAWQGAGQQPGLQIWRIVKFQVTHWNKEEYGNFFEGDSYIILNTYKEADSEELNYDVHFWIGKDSTQDEYGTAAYKTVELDTFLDDKPVQHREVMENESSLFKSYFKSIVYMSGGAESGFRHVKPEEYKTRLFHCSKQGKGRSARLEVKQYDKVKRKYLSSGDVFILDTGLKFYMWTGKDSNFDEKYQSAQYFQDMTSKRPRASKETLDEEDVSPSHEFWDYFDQDDEVDGEDEDQSAQDEDDSASFDPVLFRLSNASGELTFTEVSTGDNIRRDDLDPSDVFILDTGRACYVWVGSQADNAEKKNGIPYATQYLMNTHHKKANITCLKEGSKSKDFYSRLK